MRYFLDTEYIENKLTIDLISIGIVSEDGREYYAESLNADYTKANPWVVENVLPSLWHRQKDLTPFNRWVRDGGTGGLLSTPGIRSTIASFIGNDTPEIWGEWCSYDWLVFCQLWGKMIDLPKHYPMRCKDVVQFCVDHLKRSTEDWPESLEIDGNHNALLGAKTVKSRWEWCNSNDPSIGQISSPISV